MNNDSMPVFSVIIPTYNREKLISRAIDSVLVQSFRDFELLIIDDGSKDNTESIIQAYVKKDNRVHYFYKENGGQNSALNLGIKHAKGMYIAFLDSDDIWMEQKLEKVFQKFQTDPDLGVVYHRTGYINKGKCQTVHEDYLEGYIYKEVLDQEFLSSPTSFVAKRRCIEQVGGYDESFVMFQDDDMCFLLAKKFKIGVIKEVLGVLGGEANDRISSDPFKTAKYYVILINKYKRDILDVCGSQKLADMYYKAGKNYSYIKDRNMAMKQFDFIKKYDVEGKYQNCNFSVVFWKEVIQFHYKMIRHKVYQLYQRFCFGAGVMKCLVV